jgi:hypothetical protein
MWWYTPVIPAMWEAETEGAKFRPTQEKKSARLCLKSKLGMVLHGYNPSYLRIEGKRISI